MKTSTKLLILVALLITASNLFATLRSVDPLILPQWHSSDPWNGRCPGTAGNRANAGSHALALAKTMKYWAYPSSGTGNVSYVDDDYGDINSNFNPTINWDGMSNTLVFQTTQRYIFMCGASVFTDYEQQNSSSTLANVRTSLINYFSYDPAMQIRSRGEFTNFYWKAMIRAELDAARPVIYTVTLASGREVALLVDGYDEAGFFHINWSDVNVPDAWVELNTLSYMDEAIPETAQQMLTGIRPSLGPVNIDENFETDFSEFNWQFSGHANWTISTEAAYYGTQSAKSGNINDNQTTSMFIQINVSQPDTISFFKKISCEAEPNHLYDHLAFLIDGVEQQRWSGDGAWEYHEYPVTPGVHEFRWTYNKDGASDYFGDCAWVDAVDLPEGSTPLNPPRFVEAQLFAGNDVTVNWDPPMGSNPSLIGYRVYRNGTQIVQYNNPAQNFHNDYNLANGDYSYHLRAVYAEGISGPSNASSVEVEVPYAPTNLVAELSGVDTGHLTWLAPPLLRDRALMGYKLYRDELLLAAIESPETLEYFDHNLAQGAYYYKISAIYASGESAFSNTAVLAVGVPEPPLGLQAVVNGDDVSLSWQQVSDPQFLSGFKIYRNNSLIHQSTTPDLLGYTDPDLANGSYSYYLRAVYGDTESGNSSTVTVSVEVPYPPTGLTATVNGDDVSLSWTNPLSGRALTHYYIYRNAQVIAAVFNPNTLSYQDLNLPNGLYSYTISAFYSGVESAPSAPATALVEVLYPPTALAATVNLADVQLSWNIPATQGGLRAFLGYKVYRDGTLIATVMGGSNHQYTDVSLPNGSYNYAVSAYYNSGESSQALLNGVVVQVLYPVAVLNYQINSDDVQLWWSAPASSPGRLSAPGRDPLEYRLYRDGALLSQSALTSYDDLDLANGLYQYWVTVIYPSGESQPSPTVQLEIEVLYPPSNLSHTVNGANVNLSWDIAATSAGRGLLGYKIYRDESFIGSVIANSYTDSALANGSYQYKVSALYAGGESSFTNTVTAVVEVLYAPQVLQYNVLDRNDVALHWQLPQSAPRALLAFKLYRDASLIYQGSELSFTDTDLADGVYVYQVTALYDSGESAPSNTVSPFIEYPWPPTGLVSSVDQDDVSLNWDVLPGTQVLYQLYRDGVQIAELTTTTYLDANLPNGVYSYHLTSSNASESGVSDPSLPVNATVEVLYGPSGLVYSLEDDDVLLSWNAAAYTGGTRLLLGYDVWRDGTQIARTGELSYRDASLPNGVYQYYITAAYDTGNSNPSNSVTVNLELLYAPSNLVQSVNGNDVSLSWSAAPSSGGLRSFNGYNLYRDGILIDNTTALSYDDLNLANGTYQYYVKALYSSGESSSSNTVTAYVEVLYPPSNLSYAIADDDVTLSWNAAPNQERGLLGYRIYKDGAVLDQTNQSTYTDSDLANGSYQYYVTALYDSGESLPSNTVTVNLELLYPATNLTHSVAGDDVTLIWTAPVSSGGLRALLGYKVIRDSNQIALVNTTSYDDLNLANGLYTYSVIATYDSGDALPTNAVTAMVEVLYAPSALSHTVIGDDVSLSWTAAPTQSRAFQGYNIYRDGSLIGNTTDLNYSDPNLANGVYIYYVTALYGSGESSASNSVSAIVEVLYPPTGLSYSVDDDTIILNWTAAVSSGGLRNLLGYDIHRDGLILARTAVQSFSDHNLPNGVYQYYITAAYDSGSSSPSNTVTVNLELLYPPSLLTHTVTGDDVSLSWTAAPASGGLRNFNGYNIYRDGNLIANTAALSYEDLNLANGVYQYYVTALYASGESAASNTATAVVEVLYPPSNLSLQADADDISLTWSAPQTAPRGFLAYKVYRNGTFHAQTTATSWQDLNLANGVYSYQVSALYDSGESILIGPLSAEIDIPYPVTTLAASVNEDDVTLTWTLPSTTPPRAFQGYFIYRNGALLQVLANPSLSSWTDSGLANGDYSYYLIAVYDAGLSLPSNTVYITVNLVPDLPPPLALGLDMLAARDLRLSWQAPSPNVLSYHIYRNDTQIATTTGLSYDDLNLPNGSYQYYVKALYAEGLSSASNRVVANIMIASPPSGTGDISASGNSVSFSWNAPGQGEIGYIIYRNGIEVLYIPNPLSTSFTDSNLPNGNYLYQVAAVYPGVISSPVTIGSVRILVAYAPSGLVTSGSADTVTLSWTAPADLGLFSYYNVYRDGNFLAQSALASYTDTGLANGSYGYYISSQYQELESPFSNVESYTVTVAYAPTALNASVNQDDVTLSWTGVSDLGGFIHYRIYRDGILAGTSNLSSWQDNDLANGSYGYQITALYSFGESALSNSAAVEIELAYPATGLSYQLSGDDVQLSWTAPVNSGGLRGLLGYKVYRDGNFLAQTALPSYTDPGLVNGTYLYYVTATYSSGDSAPTSTLNVTVELLYAPSGLAYSVVQDDVTLNWSPVSSAATNLLGYRIYRNSSLIATTASTTYLDANLPNGSHDYVVKAFYPNGESDASNPVTAVIEVPYAPLNLDYTVTDNDILLTWQAPPIQDRGLQGYQLYRNDVQIAFVTGLSYSDPDMPNGNYNYYLIAQYSSGDSSPGNTITVPVFVPYTPTGVTVTGTGSGRTITWTRLNQMETHYRVYRNSMLIATIPASQPTSYSDPGISNGIHSYQVAAIYPGALISPLSESVQTTVMVAYPPTALNHNFNTGDQNLTIVWTPPTEQTFLIGYRVLLYEDLTQVGQLLVDHPTTEATFTNTPNAMYQVYVQSRYSDGTDTIESLQAGPIYPWVHAAYPPSGLTGTIDGDDILLNWNPPVQTGLLLDYVVYHRRDQGSWQLVNVLPTDTSYTLMNMQNGQYTIMVTARFGSTNNWSQSDYSNPITPSLEAPYPPSNLVATVEGNDVTLNWTGTAVPYGFQHYVILRNSTQLATTTNITYSDSDLPNGNYSYQVYAVYGGGNSNPGNIQEVTVTQAYQPQSAELVLTGNNVLISWTAPSDQQFLTGYLVYRDSGLIATLGNQLSYTDSGLDNGDYGYGVIAVYGSTLSLVTNAGIVHVEVPYPPADLVLEVADSSIEASWTATPDLGFFQHYTIFLNGNQIFEQQSTSYNFGVLPNGNYIVGVEAVYQSTVSDRILSESQSLIVAYPARDLSAVVDSNHVSLSWQPPIDAFGLQEYQIWRDSNLLSTLTALTYEDIAVPNGAHHYQIKTVYSGSASAAGNFALAEVLVAYPPSNLSYNVSEENVQLIWQAPSDTGYLTGYKVYRDGAFFCFQNGPGMTDGPLHNGTYSYYVTAVYADTLETTATNEVIVTIFMTYAAESAQAIQQESSFLISWEHPSSGNLPDFYKVWFLTDGLQSDPAAWTYVGASDSTSIVDSIHGDLMEGDFLWAVIAVYGELEAQATFTDILPVDLNPPIPTVTKLLGNYPNPFNPNTQIVFWLKQDGRVKLEIYNSRGQKVRTLHNGPMTAGRHMLPWDGKDSSGRVLGSGIYLYKLEADGYSKFYKMIMMK